VVVVPIIVSVAMYHLDMYKLTTQDCLPAFRETPTIDYLAILKKDHRALDILSKRYQCLEMTNKSLLHEIALICEQSMISIN